MRPGSLNPILICGQGRSGTTALMQMFASSPNTFADQEYPFERRYLSYFAKLAEVLSRRMETLPYGIEQLLDFDNCSFGPFPWTYDIHEPWTYGVERQAEWPPSSHRWLNALWTSFSSQASIAKPAAKFYAEKSPPWLPAYAREVMSTNTVYLFRDPRDVFISSRLFGRKDPAFLPADVAANDVKLASHVAFQFANIYANCSADRGRPDALVLLYEHMIEDQVATWSKLSARFGLVSQTNRDIQGHLTSPSLRDSVRRWQKEPLSSNTNRLFSHAIGREMRELGYGPGESDGSPEFYFSQPAALPLAASSHGEMQFSGDQTHITVTGCDFWFIPAIEPFDAESVTNIWLCVSGGVGNHCSVYWRGPGQEFSEERSFHVAYIPTHAWRVLDFVLQNHPLWKG